MSCTRRGVVWMLSAQMSFVSVWAIIKHLGHVFSTFEIVFFRSSVSLVAVFLIMLTRRSSFRIENPRALFLRCLFGFAAMLMSIYAVINLELGNAVTLFNTMPIFVALLAPALLDEPFRKLQFAIVLTAFAGIALILRPGKESFEIASVVALSAGVFSAIAMIFLRRVRASNSSLGVTFYFTLFTALGSLPFVFSDFTTPTLAQWPEVLMIGVLVTLGQVSLAKAYGSAPAATIAPFSYSSVIASYAVGLLIFSELPEVLSAIGALIVIACGVGIILTAPKEQATIECPAEETA